MDALGHPHGRGRGPLRRGLRRARGGAHGLSDPLQALVDGLADALGRPVLLDDAELRPLAYSRQWGALDDVRSSSILARGAADAVREAFAAQGIAEAAGPLRTQAVPALGMRERLCVPVRADGRTLGYLWLLDPAELDDDAVARATAAAAAARELLAPVDADAALVRGLVAGDPAALAAGRADWRLQAGPYVVVAGDATPRGAPSDGALAVVAAGAQSPLDVLERVPGAGRLGASALLGSLDEVPEGARQAHLALRVARSRPGGRATYASLGADALVAQLPAAAWRDLPAGLRHLLEDDPVLARTLGAFLDARGDTAATARALDLQRSGLYYRLGRIEERSGLSLASGDDRLLMHLGVRLARLRSGTISSR